MITDGGGPYAAGIRNGHQREFFGALQGIADVRPVDQVAAVVHRDAGKVFKCAGDQVVIIPRTADAGVGVEAGKDGILVAHFAASSRINAVVCILALHWGILPRCHCENLNTRKMRKNQGFDGLC